MCLLLAALCCLFLATLTHAQEFIVPGTAGHNWVDTHLDIAPGTLLEFTAEGRVDVGAGWGNYGPEGTTEFAPVSGYPADTPFRYGLVARLTQSRTSSQDDMREDWSFGESPRRCAAQGGHLWLTVDDDNPDNNTGAFTVRLVQSSCARFRVTLTEFRVITATVDGWLVRDGPGDEVYTSTEVAELSSPGIIVGGIRQLKSLTYGETAADRGVPPRVRAGTISPTGGLRSDDRYPSPEDPPGRGAGSIPMILWEGELRNGTNPNAVVILPTIWELDYDPAMLARWHDHAAISIGNFAALSIPDREGTALKTFAEEMRATINHNDFDRPVGIGGDAYMPFVEGTARFTPQRVFLNFNLAQALSNGPGVVEIQYQDGARYGPGTYSIFLRVERLSS